jgi:23S rRNA (uracil1939-C5)-methyltransferase
MTQREVLIESFTKRGDGLGYLLLEGSLVPSRVEIPHTIPQDRVLAEVHKKRRRVVKGRLLEVLSASPFRVKPLCEHAEICGGCIWQSFEYSSQIRTKEKIIHDTFGEFLPTCKIFPMIACDLPFHYRNKMEFSFSQNRGGMRYLGLMIAKASRYVFNVQSCHLASQWFSDVLNEVRKWWEGTSLSAYRPNENTGLLRTLTLREGKNTKGKMVVLTVADSANEFLKEEEIHSFVRAVCEVLKGEKVSIFLRQQKAEKGVETTFQERLLYGEAHIEERLLFPQKELLFKISPSSFFQPNALQAQKLFLRAIEMVKPKPQDILFDLYCGAGTVGMLFASLVRKVVGIEENAQAVFDGKENLLLNQIQNFTLHQGDVGQVLCHLLDQKDFEKPDIIVVDPPRAGLNAKALEQIITLRPKTLLYISCNPLTQIENIQNLSPYYRIVEIQPVDQFPHTYHIENIVLLERIPLAFP